MGCPHSSGNKTQEKGIERRQFLLSAVAIGGTSALSACIGREDDEPEPGNQDGADDSPNETQNGFDDSTDDNEHHQPAIELIDGGQTDANFDEVIYKNLDKEESQHAWNKYVTVNQYGVPQAPRHHVLIMADYAGTGTPDESERDEMESALETLESAYEWSNEGLLFTVGYSPVYFDRFEQTLPDAATIPSPTPLSPFDDPVLNDYDICIHLASDYAQAVIGAEEALFGNVSEINGVDVEHTAEDILTKRDRRTGFVGKGLPAENQNVTGIPDSNAVPNDAPLFMGFESFHATRADHPDHGKAEDTFVHNQNSEYGIMIKDGRFAGGTTQHVSHIHLTLDKWYTELSPDERMKRMFSVEADTDFLGEIGEDALEGGRFEGVEQLRGDIEEHGLIGHATKLARARENNVPRLLRRDFNTTDDGHAGLHFVSLQESILDFVQTRQMMNGVDVDANMEFIGEKTNNGILEFIDVKQRANFLVPPRELRAFPTPTAE